MLIHSSASGEADETSSRRKVGQWSGCSYPDANCKTDQLARRNITFTVVDGCLLIKPEKKRYTLDDLLVGMGLDNVHTEVEMGKPVGNESW